MKIAIVKISDIQRDPNLTLSATHWISVDKKKKGKKKKTSFCKSNKNK